MAPPEDTEQSELLQALLALRLPLAGTMALVFALVRIVEDIVLFQAVQGGYETIAVIIDPLLWGALAALAVWLILDWAARQERRYRRNEARIMAELRRTNANLALLNEVNQRIVSKVTLDEILDYAISLPARLIGAQATVFVLRDENNAPLVTRSVGLTKGELKRARSAFGLLGNPEPGEGPQLIRAHAGTDTPFSVCLVLPIAEGSPPGHQGKHTIGWMEAYLDSPHGGGTLRTTSAGRVRRRGAEPATGMQYGDAELVLAADTHTLLMSVAGELAEALIGARRRAREMDSLAALEKAITEERTRIARDLHDGIAQSLAFIRMRVDLWEDWLEQEPERLPAEFAGLKANLRTQIEELRRAIFALRPVELGSLGFAGALSRFVSGFAEENNWALSLEMSNLPHDLPHLLELTAFRVTQEALNNSAKHAQASNVGVDLRLADGGLQIIVRDDGIGFDPGTLPTHQQEHLGLRQMRERISALDGQLTVISRPGAGTEVRAWLPIVYARERDRAALNQLTGE